MLDTPLYRQLRAGFLQQLPGARLASGYFYRPVTRQLGPQPFSLRLPHERLQARSEAALLVRGGGQMRSSTQASQAPRDGDSVGTSTHENGQQNGRFKVRTQVTVLGPQLTNHPLCADQQIRTVRFIYGDFASH